MLEFPNIAKLKSATWLGIGTKVSVLGKESPNDGGGFDAIIDNSGDAANDMSVYQIGVSTLRAKRLLSSEVISLKEIGIKYGSVSELDRIENWRLLKLAMQTYKCLLVGDRVELHVLENEAVILTSDCVLYGTGVSSSEISIYPKLKSSEGDRLLFEHNESNLSFFNIKFDGYSNRWSYETYEATIRPTGDVDAIRLDGSVRAGFWTDLTVGDTIYVQFQNSQVGETRVVSSFDSGTGVIQCTAGFSTTDDFNVSGETKVARAWNQDALQSDIDTYSETWNTANLEELTLFRSHSNTNESSLVFKGCEFQGIDTCFNFVATNTKLVIDESILQANLIAISWTGASVNQFARVHLTNSIMEDCATVCEASVNPNGIISTNSRFGGGAYLHPGIIPFVHNSHFKLNNSTAWRNFSSSGNIISSEGWKGVFTGCTWFSSNVEPLLICSSAFPTHITNCEFYSQADGGVTRLIVGNDTFIDNCKIDVPINTDQNSEPLDNTDSRYHINISNSVLYENTKIDFSGWPGDRLKKSRLSLQNCVWYLGNQNSGYNIRVKGGKALIRDLLLANRDNTIPNFNDFIEVVEDSNFTSLKMDLYNVETQGGVTYTDATFISVDGADLSSDSNFIIRLNDCSVSGFPTFSDSKITTQQFNPTYS